MTNFKSRFIYENIWQEEVKPSFSSDKINKLLTDLIEEELEELKEAINTKDLKETIDALTDIFYVTYERVMLSV